MDQSTISSRGEHALTPMRDDQVQFQQSCHDPYEPQINPDGYLQLLIAENKLNWMMLKNKILQTHPEDIPRWVANYGNMAGNQDFRQSIAKMMQNTWIKAPIESQFINAQSGCGSILECLAWSLCETNDAVIVPGPIYPAFVNIVFQRAKVNLVVSPTKIENMYNPQTDELENTFQLCVKRKQQPKILLICQPCNPTGLIYDRETLENMICWALEKGIHVVSDEIYANSTFPDQTMISAADVMHERNKGQNLYLSDYVHIVAGLSKDFGVSGFRIGWLFSHNLKLLNAISNIGYFQSVSHLTQYLVTQLLEDKNFVDDYVIQNKKKLFQCFMALKDALDAINVPMLPAQGTLMVWADFRKYLKDNSWEAEFNLWMELFQDSKILFTTGKSCYSQQPGFFRICYTYPNVTDEDCCIAMKELKKRLINHFLLKNC